MLFDDCNRKCEKMTVTVPKITCEDETTELCQNVPHIVEGPETLEQCKVNVGEAKCSEVELVLPKQVNISISSLMGKSTGSLIRLAATFCLVVMMSAKFCECICKSGR